MHIYSYRVSKWLKERERERKKKIHNVVKYKQRKHYKQTNKQIKRTGRRRRRKKKKERKKRAIIS